MVDVKNSLLPLLLIIIGASLLGFGWELIDNETFWKHEVFAGTPFYKGRNYVTLTFIAFLWGIVIPPLLIAFRSRQFKRLMPTSELG